MKVILCFFFFLKKSIIIKAIEEKDGDLRLSSYDISTVEICQCKMGNMVMSFANRAFRMKINKIIFSENFNDTEGFQF